MKIILDYCVKSVIKKEVIEINDKLIEIEKQEEELNKVIREKMMVIPNIIDPSVPIGHDDSENVELEKIGTPLVPDYDIPYHADILESLGGLDKTSAALSITVLAWLLT